MLEKHDLLQILEELDPCGLERNDWLSVGMALHAEGYECADWERWSARDAARYKPGECEQKWRGFKEHGGIRGGTLVHIAREHGVDPDGQRRSRCAQMLESAEALEPSRQLAEYVKALFEPGELVYVAAEPRHAESTSRFYESAEIAERMDEGTQPHELLKGAYKPSDGAYVCINPMDGKGRKDANVGAYRHALVECDEMPVQEQLEAYIRLNLPCAAIVHSGNKSMHAIVKVEARDEDEYERRTRLLFETCEKNGLKPDRATKNPSRLSRLPGVMRDNVQQVLVKTNVGARSWDEWRRWVERSERAERPKSGKKGGKATVQDICCAMEADRSYDGVRYDVLSKQIWIEAPLPWNSDAPRGWTDNDDANLYRVAQESWGATCEKDVLTALVCVTGNRRYNPIQEMLEALPEWDGAERVEALPTVMLGASRDGYTASVWRTFMVAAVARAYKPSCKYDLMPILYGGQGIGKSTFVELLAMDERFFTDALPAMDNDKEFVNSVSGKWIVEVAELGAMNGRDIERVKAAVSRRNDRIRLPYGKRFEDFPRTAVLVGTTNRREVLKDATGSRRFLPIPCSIEPQILPPWDKAAPAHIAQAWAEALHYYRQNPDQELTLPESVLEEAREMAEEFREQEPWEGELLEWLEVHGRGQLRVTRAQIASEVLHIDPCSTAPFERAALSKVSQFMDCQPGWSHLKGCHRTPGSPKLHRSPAWKWLGDVTPMTQFDNRVTGKTAAQSL